MKNLLNNPKFVILTVLFVALFLAFTFIPNASAQRKPDSLVIQITIDSTQLKQVFQLISENVNQNTLTGKLVFQNIVQPLQKGIKWVVNPELKAVETKKINSPKNK
jgi:hypothetical protein